jgi:hypothetical protein
MDVKLASAIRMGAIRHGRTQAIARRYGTNRKANPQFVLRSISVTDPDILRLRFEQDKVKFRSRNHPLVFNPLEVNDGTGLKETRRVSRDCRE